MCDRDTNYNLNLATELRGNTADTILVVEVLGPISHRGRGDYAWIWRLILSLPCSSMGL